MYNRLETCTLIAAVDCLAVLFVCLFAWGLTALSPQIGYIAP